MLLCLIVAAVSAMASTAHAGCVPTIDFEYRYEGMYITAGQQVATDTWITRVGNCLRVCVIGVNTATLIDFAQNISLVINYNTGTCANYSSTTFPFGSFLERLYVQNDFTLEETNVDVGSTNVDKYKRTFADGRYEIKWVTFGTCIPVYYSLYSSDNSNTLQYVFVAYTNSIDLSLFNIPFGCTLTGWIPPT